MRILVKTFLIDSDAPVDALQDALRSHRQSFTSLKRSLEEADRELTDPMWTHLPEYAALIAELNSLTQHVGGLSSSIGVQKEVIARQRMQQVIAALQSHQTDTDTSSTANDGMLREFLSGVGPVMRALTYTCKRTLVRLERAISTGSRMDASRLHDNLELALDNFNKERSIALRRLYLAFGHRRQWDRIRAIEDLFPVYFFLFSLKRFARQLQRVVSATDRLQQAENRGFWASVRQRLANWRSCKLSVTVQPVWEQFDPKSVRDSLHNLRPNTAFRRFTHVLVRIGTVVRKFQMRYAIKSAIFAMILIAPAFMSNWRDEYQNYRGEWAVISMAVVMTPTVGGSNVVAIYRVIGTLLGSLVAYLAYTMFPGSRIMLPCAAFLFALPCFHLVLNTGYPRVGQFSCMTFTTVLMSQYAVYEDDELQIRDVALTRAFMVTVGVLAGLFATNYVWPYEARVELRQGLSDFFVNLNLLYHKMTALYSKPWSEEQMQQGTTETDPLLPGRQSEALSETGRIERSTKEFLALEMLLQLQLLKLQDLLALTRNEPRLKGPFPREMYACILGHGQSLIDRMLTMRTAVMDATWVRHIRRNFVLPAQEERRQMCGTIELYMYTVAAALLLKLPVPSYLPPITETWRALIRRVRALPEIRATMTKWDEEDEQFIVYFAYVIAMGGIIDDLKKVGECLRELYGVVGGRGQFEACFEA
ncbi:Fusaric acid resistance protein-like-domain-containing protein [Thamnocephalis sphaerospora]|uniref:Fusaric acid resistance protein-like-domain-containing protein n=1 Tax=Thamnocephalis sphaerospora TaxID=78915 RepID=A0A4P9XJ26_9FUNG|nr:Fusaric acid resistance protein-like-domain-containing protein [Thamnocephalis sphaerospora]|eukprot:RKP05200.1 Fusaric acid resistance protein-like-domain-containing protein [Thamnocephalis sphaerospora]